MMTDNDDRYEGINILVAGYFVLLDVTLSAWQAHDTSVHLIFPALTLEIQDPWIFMMLEFWEPGHI